MEHHKTVPTDGNCHKSKRLCARRRFDGSFAPRERTGESPLAFGAPFWAPKWPHGDPNRQNHRTHDWFCDREPVAKPHAARSRRTLKGKNHQNPFADRLLQKSPEVCAVRTAPEPPTWPGGRPKRTNIGSRAHPDGVGAQDGGGFVPTKLPPSHKPAPVFASSAPRTFASPPTERRRSADVPRATRGRCRTR